MKTAVDDHEPRSLPLAITFILPLIPPCDCRYRPPLMPPPHVFAHRYDVAISTACVVLDYIVVETEAGGKACIDYLRKHNLGRLSFIVLETMVKNWVDTGRMDAPIQVPAQAQRLFDLVTISEPRLRPAFYYALRDTMVIYRKPASKPPRTAPPRRPAAPPERELSHGVHTRC